MPPPSTPTPTVTRDDILRAESDFEAAQIRWKRAGRLRVSPSDISDAEADVQQLAAEWRQVEQSRLPLDQLDRFEADARAASSRLRELTIALGKLRVRTCFWGYCNFLRRNFGLEGGQLWVLSLVNGVWWVLVAGLLAVVMGWGPIAFGVLAALGYIAIAIGSLRLLSRASRSGLPLVLADLDYKTAGLRARRADTRGEVRRLRDRCDELRRGRTVRKKFDDAKARVLQLQENASCQADYDRAAGELKRLKRLLGDARYELLATDWRSLSAIPFEQFLARVFRSLGYQVQMTKTTGDQGVDLIVTRNGRRIAIQAKGYTGSVGNDSVQQAHTGMAFYGCNECVVITNSRFTRGAEELANKVGCLLIDGAGIIDLINGRLL